MEENKQEESADEQKKFQNKEKGDQDQKTLLSLLKSWDVETYLEQQEHQDENKVCEYFQATGSCPYEEVGCMFSHKEVTRTEKEEVKEEEEEEEEGEVEQKAATRLRARERLSARSRSRRINEERFRRLRDLSISCS